MNNNCMKLVTMLSSLAFVLSAWASFWVNKSFCLFQLIQTYNCLILISPEINLFILLWGCRIPRLHLCRGVRLSCPHPLPNECPGYDIKQSDGEAPVMLELWGMRSTPSLPLLPCPLWPGVVAPDGVLSMGQIEQKCILMLYRTVLVFKLRTYTKLNCLK